MHPDLGNEGNQSKPPMKTAKELVVAFEQFVSDEERRIKRLKTHLDLSVDYDQIDRMDTRLRNLRESLEKMKELNKQKAA